MVKRSQSEGETLAVLTEEFEVPTAGVINQENIPTFVAVLIHVVRPTCDRATSLSNDI